MVVQREVSLCFTWREERGENGGERREGGGRMEERGGGGGEWRREEGGENGGERRGKRWPLRDALLET